jgi:hypothetical protein
VIIQNGGWDDALVLGRFARALIWLQIAMGEPQDDLYKLIRVMRRRRYNDE